jgi:hypothetical protein
MCFKVIFSNIHYFTWIFPIQFWLCICTFVHYFLIKLRYLFLNPINTLLSYLWNSSLHFCLFLLSPVRVEWVREWLLFNTKYFSATVDSRYLEFDGAMEKIRVNCSSTQEELRKYRKCSLFNTKGRQLERIFEELKPASHVPILGTILNIFDVFVAVFFYLPILGTILNIFDVFVAVFFYLLNSLNLVERLITSRYLFFVCMNMFICFVYVFQLLHCH